MFSEVFPLSWVFPERRQQLETHACTWVVRHTNWRFAWTGQTPYKSACAFDKHAAVDDLKKPRLAYRCNCTTMKKSKQQEHTDDSSRFRTSLLIHWCIYQIIYNPMNSLDKLINSWIHLWFLIDLTKFIDKSHDVVGKSGQFVDNSMNSLQHLCIHG